MNETTFELLADLKSMKAIIRVMDENKKSYLERIASLEGVIKTQGGLLSNVQVIMALRQWAGIVSE